MIKKRLKGTQRQKGGQSVTEGTNLQIKTGNDRTKQKKINHESFILFERNVRTKKQPKCLWCRLLLVRNFRENLFVIALDV